MDTTYHLPIGKVVSRQEQLPPLYIYTDAPWLPATTYAASERPWALGGRYPAGKALGDRPSGKKGLG